MSKKRKAKWQEIPDNQVRHIWECGCPDNDGGQCLETAIVSPDWYEQNGTPVCPECEEDMVYVRTDICLS